MDDYIYIYKEGETENKEYFTLKYALKQISDVQMSLIKSKKRNLSIKLILFFFYI